MKRYDEYKDSGVEWIGEVPSHWKPCRFKDFMKLSTTASDSIHKIGLENIESATGRFIQTNTEFEGNGVEFKKDSIVYGKLRPYLQKVWLAEFEGNAVGDFFVFNAKSNSCPLYIKYLMLSDGFTKEADGSTFGAKMPRVSSDFILTLHFCLPPIMEQMCIANYLDKKCSEIDNVISAQQKRIALLQELKQSVITHAVTKGLDPNVEMKDSGVEWIGKIPASWDVVHLKRILRERMQYGANEPAESDDTTYPRYIRITDITANGELRPETFKSLEPSKAKDYLLDKGDVLFARSGATVGKTFLFNADIKACYAGYLIKASCDKRIMLPEYLYYYTQSGAYECWKNSVFIQSTIQNIGADKYQMMYIPVPSKDEQKQIVEYTMRKSQIFDSSISKAQHQVELLQEYKQSLITEVVTGKRKVS